MARADGKINARARTECGVSAVGVHDARAFHDVYGFLVGVIVNRRLARRNETDELGDLLAAQVLVHQETEQAVGSRANVFAIRLVHHQAWSYASRRGPRIFDDVPLRILRAANADYAQRFT